MTVGKILLSFEPEKENLLAAIKAVQEEFGLVNEEAIGSLANYFQMKESAVFSAASFYDEIETKQRKDLVIKVCDNANCVTKSAEKIISELENFFRQKAGDDFNKKVKIERCSCFGLCLHGPVMSINGVVFEKVTPERVDDILRSYVS